MNRFTEKADTNLPNKYIILGAMDEFCQALNKFGSLEDIEELIGIDLITIWKAIHNGVWVKNHEQGIHFISLINWNCEVSKINDKLVPLFTFSVWAGNSEDADETVYYIKDYGKTWALTEGELL